MPPQKPDDQSKPGDQSKAAEKVASQEKIVDQPKPVDQPRTGDRQESGPKQQGDKKVAAEDSGDKDPPAVNPGDRPPGLMGQQVQENREKKARELAEEQDRRNTSIPRGHASKMDAEANPVINTEVGQFIRQISEKITPIINEVSDMQDKVRRERMDAMPATGDVGEIVLEKERSGEIATQGQIDVLGLLKHHLVHVDSIARANM